MCDQETNGGGWIIVQRRMDGSVDFHQNWNGYKLGFGNPDGEFWLGNDRIQRIASIYNQLLIELQDKTNDTGFDLYQILIKPESKSYQLSVHDYYEGTAGHTLWPYFKLVGFLTYDRDYRDYAKHFRGGFWMNNWHHNLNGQYSANAHGINWYYWKNSYHTEITKTEMKLRPIRGKYSNL
jgi:hypothetical protein